MTTTPTPTTKANRATRMMNDTQMAKTKAIMISEGTLITQTYLKHVLKEGEAIETKNRKLKLYTNSSTWWSHVAFEHPATFETLAMSSKEKEGIMNDLVYYAKIGKAWKRGYLLYGPPAAMANFMNYDVYDLELTAVKDNSDLRKLLINTSSKSIIVIEDIDCSLDLTGQRKKKKEKVEGREGKSSSSKRGTDDEDDEDKGNGIWSACGGERIMVFTTNFVEKLDAALIRRGRMNKHIELSYCCYEAFKVLAKNYLDNWEAVGRDKDHPADVAENLMPKSVDEEVDACLHSLIQFLEITERKQVKAQESKDIKHGKAVVEENGVID
ncbi:hypothetical protein V8G54_012973 [Vigna mungo]|uniref:ATPase AAA-type core domain-containing protein n=1 Tax=Vigna mungo TaxID=3915 RepID=A0AAQ3S2U7_VIGMU